jgi:hypothetical protein
MLPITLQLAGRRVHLTVDAEDCRACPNHSAHKRADSPELLIQELSGAVHGDGPLLADLRSVLAPLLNLYSPHRQSDLDIINGLIALLDAGRLMAVECRLPVDERVVRERAGAAPISPRAVLPPHPARAEDPTKTWIEIELVDTRDKAIPNQRYRIRLTDGEWHEGVLDSKGRARFADLDPGNCDISFPDIHGREWTAE